MKKIVLSAVAIAAMATFGGASELSDLKAQMTVMQSKMAELEKKQQANSDATSTEDVQMDVDMLQGKVKKLTDKITTKALKLDFSGTHYLGFTSNDDNNEYTSATNGRTNKFEIRRNYLQTKAYFEENPEDYVRVTLDTFQDSKDTGANGAWLVKLKYAYLYMDNILPYTGVELGQAHRPWIDYEEHNSWFYRSISKVFVEDKNHGNGFTNSADFGADFKTKTPYFSSEVGLFNGAGYDNTEDGKGLSAEWRLTAHVLGTGEEKSDNPDLQYLNVSFFGQRNNKQGSRGDNTSKDFNWYGVHAVYNQPEFLLAAQYTKTQDAAVNPDPTKEYAGKGYGFNGEYRFMPDWSLIGMYNKYDLASGGQKKGWLGGLAYSYNKNIKFIGNYLTEQVENSAGTTYVDNDAIMATTEINW